MNVYHLVGKTLTQITVSDDKSEIKFVCNDGSSFLMYHEQDCCELVEVDDIVGDLDDLVGAPILKAEEVCSDEYPSIDVDDRFYDGTHTWTFYHFATIKGYITIKWLGESNGFYSESVYFKQLN